MCRCCCSRGAFETVDEEKLKASGANGILEKPVEPNNVIARVKELLGLKSEAKPATAGRLVTSAGRPGGEPTTGGATCRARSPPRSARPRIRNSHAISKVSRPSRDRSRTLRRVRTIISTLSMPPSTPSISNCPDVSRPRSRRAIRPALWGSRPGRPIRVRQAAVRRVAPARPRLVIPSSKSMTTGLAATRARPAPTRAPAAGKSRKT